MKTSICARFIGVIILTLCITYLNAQVKIGNNPTVINSSAILELEKPDKGLLITRVSLTSVTDITTIPSPADGLLVYNTNFGGGGNPVIPGFYYWRQDQGRWIRLSTTLKSSTGDVWIDGNNNILSANSANQNLTGTGNVVLGEQAFADWNAPTSNYIAIGHEAGKEDVTDGYADVIAIGEQAAFANAGGDVTALGFQAAQHNSGSSVNAMGKNAAQYNSNNEVNAFGTEAAAVNQGGDVIAMGSYTLHNNLGHLVNGLGPMAGMDNSGWSVNALGSESGKNNSGSELNALGAMSAQYNTASAVNALGRQAAMYNTGYGTNAFGDQAAKFNNGDHAVAIGNQALMGDTLVSEGGGNIGIGYQAGISVGTGQRNICLGYQADIPNPSANDQINIGNNIIRYSDGVIELKDLIQLTPTTEPASPVAGMIYFDSGTSKLRAYDGLSWHNLW